MEMKNKIFILGLGIFLSLFLIKTVLACMPIDSKFSVNIGPLNLDIGKLEQLCTPDKCTSSDDFITIKSHYDERVAVIIGKINTMSGKEDFKGITIRLPYNSNQEKYPTVSEIVPEQYSWKESTVEDLNFLREIGVLEIIDSQIEEISNLATNDKNIFYCENRWELWGKNCTGCGECYRCGGTPAFATSLPAKLLNE